MCQTVRPHCNLVPSRGLNVDHLHRHFIDQREINGQRGGEAYKSYGVVEPAVVIVRPDGYVGTIARLLDPGAGHLKGYFSHII